MGKNGKTQRKRGVSIMPAPAIAGLKRMRKKPNINATESLKKDKVAIAKIAQGRKEARLGKTYSWDEVFGD